MPHSRSLRTELTIEESIELGRPRTGHQFRCIVPSRKRRDVLSRAVQRSGAANYLFNYHSRDGYSNYPKGLWKAVVCGRVIVGSLSEVTDEILPLIHPFL